MMKTKLFTLVFAVLALGACKKEIKLDVKQIHLTSKSTVLPSRLQMLKLKKAVSNSTTRSTG